MVMNVTKRWQEEGKIDTGLIYEIDLQRPWKLCFGDVALFYAQDSSALTNLTLNGS